MDQAALDKIILDDKKLKKYIIEGINDASRSLFYQRCIQIRHHQAVTGSSGIAKIKPLDVSAYQTSCQSLFGTIRPPTNLPCIPDFGSPVHFHHADHLMPLSSMQQSQQSILCLIREAYPGLSHCPQLADLIAFFSRYFDDATIFALIQLMLTAKHSSNKAQETYYFTLNGSSFVTFIKKFYLLLKNHSESTKHHLKHMGIDMASVFQSWAQRCYSGYHPQSTVIRFLDGFVAFGMPWMWTWSLALIDLHRKAIMNCASAAAVSLLFFGDMHACDSSEVVEHACLMQAKVVKVANGLQARQIERYVLNTVAVARESSNHVPRITGGATSEILSPDHFCAIWCWIDDSLKVTNPELLYASSKHGYSLRALLERCTTDDPTIPHPPTVTVAKSTTGVIFGVYLSHSWVQDSDAARLKQASRLAIATMGERETKLENERLESRLESVDRRSFVFMLAPQTRCFRQPQARQEREKKQRAIEAAETERKLLKAGREGLRSRDSRTSSAAQHAVDDSSADYSYDDTSTTAIESWLVNTRTISSKFPLSSPRSPVADRSSALAAQLLQLMEEQRDQLDEKHVSMMCSSELLAIGDSLGVAFSLDANLRKGVSQSTNVFDNESLALSKAADGSFDCSAVEVWGFKEPNEQWTIR